MKKIIAITITLFIISTCAYSESNSYFPDIHWDMLSDDDIHSIINTATDILNSRTQYAQTIDPIIYNTDEIQFSLMGPYLYSSNNTNYIFLGFDWINTSNKPSDFSFRLSTEAYQNGHELEKDTPHGMYSFKNISTKYLPGYGGISYVSFVLDDTSSETTLIIDDFIDLTDHFNDIQLTIIPNDLQLLDY